MKAWAETHGVKFELVRHFVARMLDGEWSSTPGQWRNVAIGAFAMLVPAGLLILREGSTNAIDSSKYRRLAELADKAPLHAAMTADTLSLITVVLAVTGLLGLIQWQSLFPGRRDYLSLAGLPIRSRQIFLARFAAVMLFSAGVRWTVAARLDILAQGRGDGAGDGAGLLFPAVFHGGVAGRVVESAASALVHARLCLLAGIAGGSTLFHRALRLEHPRLDHARRCPFARVRLGAASLVPGTARARTGRSGGVLRCDGGPGVDGACGGGGAHGALLPAELPALSTAPNRSAG